MRPSPQTTPPASPAPKDLLRAETISERLDISKRTFQQWVAAGKFPSLRAFLNWCVNPNRKRFPANQLLSVADLPHAPTFKRRSLTAEQVGALLATAPPERSRVYRIALATGLRRQELADLQWGDVIIDGPTPFLKLRAAANKSRRADSLPLRNDVAADLRMARPAAWRGGNRVFVTVPTVEELRGDLQKAGVVIPDDEFDRVDFHGLRTTLGSFLAKAGTAPRVAMELMRHTDMRLTQTIYTDPRIFDTAGVVNALPLDATPREAAAATGTDGAADLFGKKSAIEVHADTRSPAPTCTDDALCKNEKTPDTAGVSRQSAPTCAYTRQSGKSSASRTRTYTNDAETPANIKFSDHFGKKSDIPCADDPDFEALRAAWSTLSAEVRARIMALAGEGKS